MTDPRDTPMVLLDEPEYPALDAAEAVRIIAELEDAPDAEPWP